MAMVTPSPYHAFGAGPSLSRKGSGAVYAYDMRAPCGCDDDQRADRLMEDGEGDVHAAHHGGDAEQ